MINESQIKELGLEFLEKYSYDASHFSYVYKTSDTCIIIDDDLCHIQGIEFDYSKYCEMQNRYMSIYSHLYRFNDKNGDSYPKIKEWLSKTQEDISISDDGGYFDTIHLDNTPLEKTFEDLFIESYGEDSLKYLKKEYSISLDSGNSAFVDYVVETRSGNYAIEENGVFYHHPVLIGDKRYEKQLEKQNTLSLYNFKVFRFSTSNLAFKDQTIDNIRFYLGDKENFIDSLTIKEERKFKLFDHQEEILSDINKAREEGINTSLVVLPMGSGKSQIVIEDMENLIRENKIKNALIMVPSNAVKSDWEKRIDFLGNQINIEVKFYNTVFLEKNSLEKDHYDYIVFDEAHHAQAANCKKTLQYFIPKYLIGLTATPDRLDNQKLEEIFGQYESKLSFEEAIEKGVISNIRCFRLLSNIDLSEVRYNGVDYNYADLEKTLVIDSRNELIVSTIKKYFAPTKDFYKQGIVFCVNVDHCKKLEKMLNNAGIKAKAVYGAQKNNDEIMEEYKNKKIQFLLSCQLISEGWDSPQTEVVVMARPTLSKVLYLQQLGRGVRNYPGKECLYVVDVVDNYAGKLAPWSFNALFKIEHYSDFMGVINNNFDYLSILGLSEREISMQEVDVFTFEEKYKDYLSLEQAARELYVGTNTLAKWVKNNPELSSLSLPIGKRNMPYFSQSDIDLIRSKKGLEKHDNSTILKDFIDFIDENTLTFSFKLIFMINMLSLANKEGEVNVDDLVKSYSDFYLDRLDRGLPVDRKNCIYDYDYLMDEIKMKKSILDNPFEKFERKRFVYYSKDLNILSFNPILWQKLTDEIKNDIINKEQQFLINYYKNLGGL